MGTKNAPTRRRTASPAAWRALGLFSSSSSGPGSGATGGSSTVVVTRRPPPRRLTTGARVDQEGPARSGPSPPGCQRAADVGRLLRPARFDVVEDRLEGGRAPGHVPPHSG